MHDLWDALAERAQLITTYIGAHMSSSALRENSVHNENEMTIEKYIKYNI